MCVRGQAGVVNLACALKVVSQPFPHQVHADPDCSRSHDYIADVFSRRRCLGRQWAESHPLDRPGMRSKASQTLRPTATALHRRLATNNVQPAWDTLSSTVLQAPGHTPLAICTSRGGTHGVDATRCVTLALTRRMCPDLGKKRPTTAPHARARNACLVGLMLCRRSRSPFVGSRTHRAQGVPWPCPRPPLNRSRPFASFMTKVMCSWTST